jgi:hypothetical protein
MITPPSSPLDLRRTLEESLLVRHIATLLESRNGNQDAAEVRAYMEARNFDVMGLQNCDKTTHYVCREELGEGSCQDYARQIEATQIVSSATPLIDLLPLLADQTHLFVLEGAKLASIVTSADLQKSPVRMLLFGLVSLLEMYLLLLVRRHYPDESFRSTLKSQRLEEAQRLYEKRMARNQAIDLADCLQICDKRDLILRKLPCATLGFDSKRRALKFFEHAEDLRNNLAHSQDLVLGSSWTSVIELAVSIDSFLQRFENLAVDKGATR